MLSDRWHEIYNFTTSMQRQENTLAKYNVEYIKQDQCNPSYFDALFSLFSRRRSAEAAQCYKVVWMHKLFDFPCHFKRMF